MMDTGQNVSDCTAKGSVIACVTQNISGSYCGTYQGDYICVHSAEPGQCVAYQSGGVACVVSTVVPTAAGAPDTGTPGTPAVPVAAVSDGATGDGGELLFGGTGGCVVQAGDGDGDGECGACERAADESESGGVGGSCGLCCVCSVGADFVWGCGDGG